MAKTYLRIPSQALKLKVYAQQAYGIYKHLCHTRGQADSLHLLALTAAYEKNAAKAQALLLKAQALYECLDDDRQAISMQSNQSFLQLYVLGNPRKALEVAQKSYDKARAIGMGDLAKIANNVSACFNKLGNPDSSVRYSKASLEQAPRSPRMQGLILVNMATALRMQGDFSQGLSHQYKVLPFLKENDQDYPDLMADMALNHLALSQKDKALSCIRQAEKVLEKTQNKSEYLVFAVKALVHNHFKNDHEAKLALNEAQDVISQNYKHLSLKEQASMKKQNPVISFVEAAQQNHWQKGETLLS